MSILFNKTGQKLLVSERMYAIMRRYYTDISQCSLNGHDFIFIVPSKNQQISHFKKENRLQNPADSV